MRPPRSGGEDGREPLPPGSPAVRAGWRPQSRPAHLAAPVAAFNWFETDQKFGTLFFNGLGRYDFTRFETGGAVSGT